MRLVLDAMGGDHAPAAPVEGALLFAREYPAHEVVLVGELARLREPLARAGGLPPNVRLHPASQVVEMEDHAITAIRRKKDSSLRVGFELVRRGEAEALVSAGHSGAVMAGGLLVLGRIPGVERPGAPEGPGGRPADGPGRFAHRVDALHCRRRRLASCPAEGKGGDSRRLFRLESAPEAFVSGTPTGSPLGTHANHRYRLVRTGEGPDQRRPRKDRRHDGRVDHRAYRDPQAPGGGSGRGDQ